MSGLINPPAPQCRKNLDCTDLLIQVLGSQPVTPVRVDRYETLLVGYSPALKTLYIS